MDFYDIRFYPEDNFCIAVCLVKSTSLEEITKHSLNDVYGHEEWITGMKVLWDLRSLTTMSGVDFNVTFSQTGSFYKGIIEKIGNGRRAFLVSTPALYGMYRRWEMMSGLNKVLRTYKTLDEALEWLGVTNEEKYGLR